MRRNVITRVWCVGMAAAALAGASVVAPATAGAQISVGISIGTPPPPLPYYEQPVALGPDFIWTPGYWAWGSAGYFWVPGAWVLAPRPGLLWTPGYWGWNNSAYVWYPGYWGRRVGYYGGINYGYGYFGADYVGGRWYRGHFRYNTAVTRVNTTVIHNVYVDRRVIVNNNTTVNRVSYNGGHGGIVAAPRPTDLSAGRRIQMTDVQTQHERLAGEDRNQLAAVNHDHPKQLAVSTPFSAQNRASTFEPIRPTDRTAMHTHGGPVPRAPMPARRTLPRAQQTPSPSGRVPARQAPSNIRPENVRPREISHPVEPHLRPES